MGFGGGNNALLQFQMAVNNMFGMAQYSAAQQESAMLHQQASAVITESEAEAQRRAREVMLFREGQAHSYAAGGVMLNGSPLAVLEETRRLGAQEVDSIRNAGLAQARLITAQAGQVENQGLQTLLGVGAENTTMRLQEEERRRQERAQLFGSIFRGAMNIGSSVMGSF